MPNDEESVHIKRQFHNMAGFPGIIGCIDGTHIRVACPVKVHNAASYMNRKGYHSLIVQMVCDSSMKITNVVARWPGSSHDSRIFRSSTLRDHLEDGTIRGILLGDNGYACERYLLTPVLRAGTDSERRYNTSHRRTRNITERVFGLLKRGFPCIGVDSRLRCHIETSKAVIVALCVLHNISRDNRDADFPGNDVHALQNDVNIREQNNLRGLAFRRMLIQNHFH
ncbi:putative nuclease HARBI1 [Gigantopelta aegis]|uniref:putative nuclease HARBI1 n=1 Tax=Gigantopelta aegis TaxID=1735272 RepID=UPI001B88A4B8|nr:putative nuclease HARBI1 [Gigantopelta aegis]